MKKKAKQRCFLIGEGTLLIQCAEILLKRKYEILGVISSQSTILEWCNRKRIHCTIPTKNCLDFLSQQPFDYLFSIFNEFILSKEILNLPRQGTINYHDAPLPKYAGINATSWALINREKKHGVSWHLVNEVVDAGDILKQTLVELERNETAFTLNAKCYEAAIASFAELIEDISLDRVVRVEQNLKQRTYYGRSKRLSNAGLISFNCKAQELDAKIRAVDFRSYPNSLGIFKLSVGNILIGVSRLEILDDRASVDLPGTITEIGSDFLTVATKDYEVALKSLQSLDGEILSIEKLVNEFQLQVGDRFGECAPELIEKIEKFDSSIAKSERFWQKRLKNWQPISIPYATRQEGNCADIQIAKLNLSFPRTSITFTEDCNLQQNREEFLLTAFASYLSRISSINCFDIGLSYIELQNELSGLEGIFADLVPWRLEIETQQSFEKNLVAVSKQLKIIKRHKSYPRDLGIRTPQLRAQLLSEGEKLYPVVIKIVDHFTSIDSGLGSELTLIISRQTQECCWLYNTRVLDEQCIERMHSQFTTFVESIISDRQQTVAYLPLLSPQEQHQILVEWNDTHKDYPRDLCLHQLFEERVEQVPDSIAIAFANREITYADLNRRANRLAVYLQKLGVKPEVKVGVCLEYSVNAIVGILGILKAGGAYVPIDPNYPQERLAHILLDAQIPILLTQKQIIPKLPKHKAKIICLDRELKTDRQESDRSLNKVKSNNLAYTIYTSGSTGKPKGVALEHRSALNTIFDINRRFQINRKDKVLCLSSLSFDLSVYDIFGLLGIGGTLVIPKPSPSANPGEWLELIDKEKVTIWNTAPAVMELFANYLSDRNESLPDSLRLILMSGDRIPVNLPVQLKKISKNQKLQIISLGGATEASIWSIIYPIEQNDPQWKSIPYGRPLSNQSFYILDAQKQPVPIGITGELYIGGIGLAREYLNRPELTEEKFIPNPYTLTTALKDLRTPQIPRLPLHPDTPTLYKTGDLGRYLPDGNIEFLGRIDRQVKIRGFRIELGEIETILTQHPSIREAIAIVREDLPGRKWLVAYLVSSLPEQPTNYELTSFLKNKLPEYAIPSTFVFLNSLPLTPNGKLDRNSLPPPTEIIVKASNKTFVCPNNQIQIQLSKIWEKILGIKQISIKDNFFEIGGNSLIATRLFCQIEQEFGKNLPLATLFQAPTIEELASVIHEQKSSVTWSSLVPIYPNGFKLPFFCVHALGGNVLSYQRLARHLGVEQPFYGLQAIGLDGQREPFKRIEDMAAHYLSEVLAVQPHGPYFLGGHSFGGLIALEMAQQLHRQGYKVSFLGLFDTPVPHYVEELALRDRFAAHLNNISNLDLKERIIYISKKFKLSIEKKIPTSISQHCLQITDLFRSPQQILYRQVAQANRQALANYIPSVYPGKITLFRAKIKHLQNYFNPDRAWGQLALGGVEVHEVPGDHDSFLLKDANSQVFAKILNECLEKEHNYTSNSRFISLGTREEMKI